MLNAPAIPSLELINMEVLTEAEMTYHRKLVTLRDYYDGTQDAKVTDRLKEFMPSLSKGFDFTLNVSAVIIEAVTEYLNIKNWDSDDFEYVEWIENLWVKNKMASMQDEVHEQALVDGESFLLVSWDNDKQRAVWTPEKAYTDTSVGGSGEGCKIFYPANNPHLDPLYAVKRWSELDERGRQVDFKTLYYPDRIEKYWRNNGLEWLKRIVEGEEWPAPWTDDEGEPLGVPIIHFRNKRGASEIEDILAIQDAVNKSALDSLISSDSTAFRIYVALGWIPTIDGKPPADDGSNIAEIQAGQVYGTTNPNAKFLAIDPPKETIEGLSALTQQFLVWAAVMSDTPATRVITTKLVASDETLKQQEKPLETKVALRRDLFTPSWVQAVELSRELEAVYGEAVLNMESDASPIWGSRLQETAKDLEALKIKADLQIPREQIWREMGYSHKKIRSMLEMSSQSMITERDSSDQTNTNVEEEQDNGTE